MSRFTKNVDPKKPHPEYPRPQFSRSSNSWLNLNGEWKFKIIGTDQKDPEQKILIPFSPESYLSGVSKQLFPDQTANYSRNFDLTNFFDPMKQNERLILNFGAIDQVSWIYINNKLVGNNTNGYIPFSFDITNFVYPGNNFITVFVQDFSEKSSSVIGKQRILSGGTFYTAQSGIWQTVWLEKVPSLYIKSISLNPVFTLKESYVDFFNITLAGNYPMDNSSIEFHQNDLQFKIDIYSNNKLIFSNISNYNHSSQNLIRFTFPEPEVHPWHPSSPYLYKYNITLLHRSFLNHTNFMFPKKLTSLRLLDTHNTIEGNNTKQHNIEQNIFEGNHTEQNIIERNNTEQHIIEENNIEEPNKEQQNKEQQNKEQQNKEQQNKEQQNNIINIDFSQDIVNGYFALRSFTKEVDSNGIPRIFLNGEPYFQLGVLDQGYWSDGLMTPPTDDAITWDIQLLKAMGFNMIRKHAKIAPLRFYYHCDRLGMIVWQDMVPGFTANKQSEHRKAVVRLLRDIPCICTWTLFNQDWGKYKEDPQQALNEVRELDYGKRLIDTYSGGMDDNLGDFMSIHCYQENLIPFLEQNDSNGRIFALTEFGGLEYNSFLNKNSHSNVYGMFPFRKSYNSESQMINKYKDIMLNQLLPLLKTKLSATVFTQLSDIENEINGLVTFNRKHIKFNIREIAEINRKFKFPLE